MDLMLDRKDKIYRVIRSTYFKEITRDSSIETEKI